MEEEVKSESTLDDKMLTLNLTVKQVNELLTILGNCKFNDVNAIILNIYSQGKEQIAKMQAEQQ